MDKGLLGKIIHSTSGPRRWEDMRSTGLKEKRMDTEGDTDRLALAMGGLKELQ